MKNTKNVVELQILMLGHRKILYSLLQQEMIRVLNIKGIWKKLQKWKKSQMLSYNYLVSVDTQKRIVSVSMLLTSA